MKDLHRKNLAMSLVELLVVIAVIGIISAIAIPSISRLSEASNKAKTMVNAKNLEQMSAALASLGVAHVVPDSMGGVEATARLMREGVIVPEGPMAGEQFIMAGLSDDDIADLADYLRVQYDMSELRLVSKDPDQGMILFEAIHLYCEAFLHPHCRIEIVLVGIA